VYTKKRRPNDRAYSKEYVQLLEEQQVALVKGMKELYRRSSQGESLPDLPNGCNDKMLIHEVLSSLNVLPKKVDTADFDFDQTCSTPQSSRASSVCESMPSQPFFSRIQTPVLSMSSTISNVSASPPIPSMNDFECLMNSLDSDQLEMMQNLPLVTPKAVEYPSLEAFTEAYLVGHDFSAGPPPDFVNPRDTFQSMPFHMMHAYTM